MPDKIRGTVTKIAVTVSYPDGSTKTTDVDTNGLEALYFSESAMSDEVKNQFTPSQDWKDNPTFAGHRNGVVFNTCNIAQCKINNI